MLHTGTTLIALQADSLWWIGLFTSTGGLLIVGEAVVILLLLVLLIHKTRRGYDKGGRPGSLP
jgi:putative copper export protein